MSSNKNFAKFINIDGKYRFYNDESDLIKIYQEKLDQLTNNWNELEEWIKNENSNYVPLDSYVDGTNATYEEILDKMKEIKEKK